MRTMFSGAIALVLALVAVDAAADNQPPTMPVVTLTAAATASVPNDRMYAWLRAEVDNADPARAAAEVNARDGQGACPGQGASRASMPRRRAIRRTRSPRRISLRAGA